MHCTKCGKAISGDAKFCKNCGTEVAEEKPRSFKLQKNVSTKQYGITALVGILLGLIFLGSFLGSVLFLIGVGSGIAWLFRVVKSKTLKWILAIFLILLAIPFFYGMFLGISGS